MIQKRPDFDNKTSRRVCSVTNQGRKPEDKFVVRVASAARAGEFFDLSIAGIERLASAIGLPTRNELAADERAQQELLGEAYSEIIKLDDRTKDEPTVRAVLSEYAFLEAVKQDAVEQFQALEIKYKDLEAELWAAQEEAK